jgi:hypothetical protein
MNPGPTLGLIAVVASYTVVLVALLVFVSVMSGRRRRLERRRQDLQTPEAR